MDVPTSTASDIEDEKEIDILGCVEFVPEEKPERRTARLVDREGEQFELTLFSNDENYEIEKGEWYVFRAAEGDVYEPTDSIGITPSFGDMTVQKLGEAPSIVNEEVRDHGESLISTCEEPVSVEEGPARAVVDIETVLANGLSEAELDLENSDHVELLCIGVGYRPAPDIPENVDVLFRANSSAQAEYELMDALCEWLEQREPDEVLTYHGSFDRGHLRGRSQRLESELDRNGVSERLEKFLRDDRFRDLGMSGMSLEDAVDTVPTYWDIYQHDLTPSDWRTELRELERYPENKQLDDPEMTHWDIASFGARYLELADSASTRTESQEFRALSELLRHYTAGDIGPVFGLT